jgi:hypothetical protein
MGYGASRWSRAFGVAAIAAATLAASSPAQAAPCTSPPCGNVVVEPPYRLGFDQDHGGVADRDGTGTGFTDVLPRPDGAAYEPDNLVVSSGLLRLTTTEGIQYQDANSLENALAVGLPPGGSVFTMATTLVNPPGGSRRYEQGGLWFGRDQDNYAKLVLNSPPSRLRLEYTLETNGARTAIHRVVPPNLRGKRLTLLLRGDPLAQTLTAWYSVDSSALVPLATFVLPPEMFSTLGGIFATHRRGDSPLTYDFDDFRLLCHSACERPDPGDPGPFSGGPSTGVIPGGPGSVNGGPGSVNATLAARTAVPRRIRSSVLLKRGVKVRVWCSTTCNAHSRLVARGGAARKLRSARSAILGRGTGGDSNASRFKVRIRLSRSAARKLRRARNRKAARTVSLRVSTHLTGAGGQAIKSQRRLVVKL